MVNQKIIKLLNNLLVLSLTIFIVFSPYSKKIVKICFFAAIILAILINILKLKTGVDKRLFINSPLNKEIIFFIIALVLATIFSLDPYYSQGILLERFLPYFIFFSLGNYAVKERNNVIILIGAIVVGGIILGVGGFYDLFYFRPERLFNSFGYSVSLARFFVIQIPLSYILLFFSRNKILKIGGGLSLIFLFPCLIANSARAAWVAVIISIILVSLNKDKKKNIILLSILSLGFLCFSGDVRSRALTTLDPARWGERVSLWKMAIRMFIDYPLFGVGLGMQEKLFDSYWRPIWPYLQFKYWHVHNNYLEVAAESGIVGLITFIYLIRGFLKKIYIKLKKLKGEEEILLSGLFFSSISVLIFAVSASNITVGVQETTLVWFLFGMGSGFKSLIE
ncbi:MAG: O-antigen ligase family protein [Candidatus Omnitrophica bacterium]|nr:O-antigen ligase family protein [Candidatus Omnitrophota bacterium]